MGTRQQPETRWRGALLLTLFAVGGSFAAVPELITYQGKLLDGGGVPVVDAVYPMEFRFYDACVGGNLLLTDTQTMVPTANGIYSVLLGGGGLTPGLEPDLFSVFSNHDAVCLGVKVGADSEMFPRQLITATGYAVRAMFADNSPQGVGLAEDVTWTGTHTFESTVNLSDGFQLAWPHITGNPPPDSTFSIVKFHGDPPGQALHPNGESDEQWMVCYNCLGASTFANDPTQHSFNLKIEANFFDGDRELQEYNWNLRHPAGGRIASNYDLGAQPLNWRPFGMTISLSSSCQGGTNNRAACTVDGECPGGFCGGENNADFFWKNNPLGYCESDHQITCTVEYEETDCGVGGNCKVRAAMGLTKGGTALFGRGIDLTPVRTGDLSNSGETLIRNSVSIEPGESSPGVPDTDGVVYGLLNNLNYNNSSIDGSGLGDFFGVSNFMSFSGSKNNRTISSSLVHFDAQTFISQTGTGATINKLYGLRVKHRYTGANVTIDEVDGIHIATPQNAGTNISIDRAYGVRIQDQLGLGDFESAALTIDSQSGGNGNKGNLWMEGGDWNNGHLQLGSAHLWVNGSTGRARFSTTPPTGQTDGTPLHSPPGTNANWGGMYWGNDGSAAHDTGNEVCALAGLSCLETYDMGSASAQSCASSTHSTNRFMALCH